MTSLAGRVDATRYRALRETHEAVVVDFWATWCAPCVRYSPVFERVAREFRRDHPDLPVAFCAVDVDLAHEAAREARVQAVPTTVVFRRGRGFLGRPRWRIAWRGSGLLPPRELREALDRTLVPTGATKA